MRTMHRRKLCFYYLIMASCAVTVFFVALSCVISMDHHHHSGDHYNRIQSAYGESMPSSPVDSLTASALQQGQPFPSISRYCSIQVPSQHGINEVQAQHLSLIHVAIAIRHGDRSSIHSIPNSSIPARLDHSSLRNNMTLLNDTALLYSPYLRHFELKMMPSTAATDGALKVRVRRCTQTYDSVICSCFDHCCRGKTCPLVWTLRRPSECPTTRSPLGN